MIIQKKFTFRKSVEYKSENIYKRQNGIRSSSSPLSKVNTLKAANVHEVPDMGPEKFPALPTIPSQPGWEGRTVPARSAQLALVAPEHQSFLPKWRNYSFKRRLPFYVPYIFFGISVPLFLSSFSRSLSTVFSNSTSSFILDSLLQKS